jgi:hypothetical protein
MTIIDMNSIAEQYVRLVLAVGEHDPDYVDAYHGPAQWRQEAKARAQSLNDILLSTRATLQALRSLTPDATEDHGALRYQYLQRQLESLAGRVELLQGRRLRFDEESRVLYDAVAPAYPEHHFASILRQLETLLPGKGTVQQRYSAFKDRFVIAKEKLDLVFKAAIEECRKRTKQHIALPDDETFVLEYVTNKSWSGYNWYQGNSTSLIQINTDLPISIDRAIDLGAHEGYPGHHVYNTLLEHNLLRNRGWMEFSVYALFSPQSLIAEGTANFGIEVVFTPEERIAFERDVLFPLAGLDASMAELYYKVHGLFLQLAYAGNEAARGYLDGTMTKEQAVEWLMRYALFSRERAIQRIAFFETYRSYVINYNLGQDMVRRYIEARGGTSDNPARRWEEFAKLLSSPRFPSGLLVNG